MPHYRVSESLPAELGAFDLVIIDEASQSDFSALPTLLRAQKVLIFGDDKQVPPEGVGLEEDKIRNLMARFLGNQVETFRAQMTPERSIYDLCKVVFAGYSVMLKEHFRCVGPIIEYSKREFYNHELKPLRLPKASERIDPPLIDVFIEDGFICKTDNTNTPEARFIVDEILAICADQAMIHRTIGVVSLLGDKQALKIWKMLEQELGPEKIAKFKIACGDARTFQGKERNIMFLSMVIAHNETITPILRGTYAQYFNVAASRARDRMYLVRSVGLDALTETDELRRGLVSHFAHPFSQEEKQVDDLRELCESPFERQMYDELTGRGYRVKPQVKAGDFRIDMVVEGDNDARLAVECDGDRYHGPEKWDEDMFQQRILERAGWQFWRCFASIFVMHREEVLQDLVQILTDHGVHPIGADRARRSVYIEYRAYSASKAEDKQQGFENEEIQEKANAPDTGSVLIIETPTDKFQIIDEIAPLPPLDEKEDETDSEDFIKDDAVAPLPPLDEKEDETDSLRAQVGDFIDYIDLSIPNHRYHIWIALGQDGQDADKINEAALISQCMLKMKEGDTIEFNVPERPQRRLKIIKISRPTDLPWR